jgi:hypothetical protein
LAEATAASFAGSDEVAIARRLGPRRIGRRFRPRQFRLRGIQCRLIGSGIDLVELLPSLDLHPFGEQALQDDTVDLRPDFGQPCGRGAAGQFRRDIDRLRLERHDPHLRRRAALRATLGHRVDVVASRCRKKNCNRRQRVSDWPEIHHRSPMTCMFFINEAIRFSHPGNARIEPFSSVLYDTVHCASAKNKSA